MNLEDKVIQLINEGKTYREIAQQLHVSIGTISKIKKKKQKQEAETKPPEKPTEPEAKVEFQPIPITEIPAEEEKPEEIAKELVEKVEEGAFTPDEIASLFESVNTALAQYAPPKDSPKVLGRIWCKVINRRIEKIEQYDIIIAVICTAVIYIPSIAKLVKEKLKKKEEEKKIESKTPS